MQVRKTKRAYNKAQAKLRDAEYQSAQDKRVERWMRQGHGTWGSLFRAVYNTPMMNMYADEQDKPNILLGRISKGSDNWSGGFLTVPKLNNK